MYIIKPGENTNRGNGIIVCHTLQEIRHILVHCSDSGSSSLADKVSDEKKKTFIVQRYIDWPLLINRRKFDIWGYGLFTSINGVQKGYFYEDGYLWMSSKEYNTNSTDVFIHLTNDAI